MQRYLKKKMKRLSWNKTENDGIIYFTADNRRIQFYSRKNPEQKIYHTILVERNGYIQSVFSVRNTREWDISSWVERFMTCIGKIQGPGRQ